LGKEVSKVEFKRKQLCKIIIFHFICGILFKGKQLDSVRSVENNSSYDQIDWHCNTAKRPYRKTYVYMDVLRRISSTFFWRTFCGKKAWSCRITSKFLKFI
jgi:hypothetical protein